MKTLALLVVLTAAACGSAAPTPAPDAGGGGAGGAGSAGAGGMGGGYPTCPQHRVEAPECPSTTAVGGVLRKDGLICATCSGVDSSGQPTAKPVDCKTVAGSDLCVADCNECS